jgi:hypothetical protein
MHIKTKSATRPSVRVLTLMLGLLVAGLASSPALEASAKKPVSPVKKTMDGRCLTIKHADYWKTKIYVSKPTVAACVASGGRQV